MQPREPVDRPTPATCPACGGGRIALVALPGSGPTGQRLCLGCGALWHTGA